MKIKNTEPAVGGGCPSCPEHNLLNWAGGKRRVPLGLTVVGRRSNKKKERDAQTKRNTVAPDHARREARALTATRAGGGNASERSRIVPLRCLDRMGTGLRWQLWTLTHTGGGGENSSYLRKIKNRYRYGKRD